VKWPSMDKLQQLKLTLEVIVLLLLVPLFLVHLAKGDHKSAAMVGLAAR
jgi:hypothetical protein